LSRLDLGWFVASRVEPAESRRSYIVFSSASAWPAGSFVSIACSIFPSGPTTKVSRFADRALASSAAP
jgi:hypothetical protein